MDNLFEVKVLYIAVDEKGKDKRIKETYLIQANSFGESEEKMIEEDPSLLGNLIITDIKKSKLQEIYTLDGPCIAPYFKVDVEIEEQDVDTGAIRKSKNYWLIQAEDLDKAHKRANEIVNSYSLVCFNIIGIKKSPIVEWIPEISTNQESDKTHEKAIINVCNCNETCSENNSEISKAKADNRFNAPEGDGINDSWKCFEKTCTKKEIDINKENLDVLEELTNENKGGSFNDLK